MSFGLHLDDAECLAHFERRQFRLGRLGGHVALFVATLLVGLQEAAEGDDRSTCCELGRGRACPGEAVEAVSDGGGDDDGCGGTLRVRHLRGHSALPDEVVELPVVAPERAIELARCAERVTGRTDGLVCLLRVLALAAVQARLFGNGLRAVERCRLRARRVERLLRQIR